MTATAAGPYEHRGAYEDSEFFDTSGAEISFCPDCEHDPCIAGGNGWCSQPPRFITVQAISAQIEEAAGELREGPRAATRELWLGFLMALRHRAIAERGEDAS